MLWMMPIMFTFFSLSFPSGLSLYWLVSNIFSIVTQYFVTGWGGLSFNFKKAPASGKASERDKKLKKRIAMESTTEKGTDASVTIHKEELKDGQSGDTRQDSGRSDEKSSNPIKRWFGRG